MPVVISPKDKIQQTRRCLLIHSFLRDKLDCQLVPDEMFLKWGKDLRIQQHSFCMSAREADYWEMFKGWDPHNPDYSKLKYDDEIRELAVKIYRANMESMS